MLSCFARVSNVPQEPLSIFEQLHHSYSKIRRILIIYTCMLYMRL
jgi:hypothetical protein